MSYDTCNCYWLRENGKKVFSSKYQVEVPVNDPDYQEWLAEGNSPQPYPKDISGNESRDEMNNILRVYGLRVFPLTEQELLVEQEARRIGVVTRYEARRLLELELARERRRYR